MRHRGFYISKGWHVWEMVSTFVIIAMGVAVASPSYAQSPVPDGIAIESDFRSGTTPVVGRVDQLHGKVIIIHTGEQTGYLAKPDVVIHKNDTVVTMENSRIRIRLNDSSNLTLAANTRLEINRSIYQPKTKVRSSFLKMSFGKARFWVIKKLRFKQSEFKVKTQTAVIGVRGSDFIVQASDKRTEVTALRDTVVAIWSLTDLGREPELLRDYQRSIIDQGKLPTKPMPVPMDKIDEMILEVMAGPGVQVSASQPSMEGSATPASRQTEKDSGTEPGTDDHLAADQSHGEATTDRETLSETPAGSEGRLAEQDRLDHGIAGESTLMDGQQNAMMIPEGDLAFDPDRDVASQIQTELPVELSEHLSPERTVSEQIETVVDDLDQVIRDEAEPDFGRDLPPLPEPPRD